MQFNTPLHDLIFSVVDTETTALGLEKGGQMVEIAVTRIVPKLSIDLPNTFSSLIKPTTTIPPYATAIHGITDQMTADAPPVEDVIRKFATHVSNTILVAHNAPFDLKFIQNALYKSKVPKTFGHVFDSVKIARRLLPHLPSHSLDSLIQHYKAESPRVYQDNYRHRAMFDADITAVILLKMLTDAENQGIYTLGDLYEFVG